MLTLEPNSNLRPGDEVALTCEAYGGYPKASVVWRDAEGRNLTDNITTSHVANEQGLFSLTSILTVILEPSSTYSCQLVNPLLGEEGITYVTITGEWDTISISFYKEKETVMTVVHAVEN